MALNLALDVNRYTDFVRGEPDVVERLRLARRIVLPFVALGELRAGFKAGRRAARNEKSLSEFLQSPRVEVLYADEGTTHFYAMLFDELRTAGTPIPTNDLWIAAIVMQHDLVLYSRDRHFERLVRIPRI